MKKIIFSTITLILFWLGAASANDTLGTSNVWYASLLRQYFPFKISIHGIEYSTKIIPCLPKDITKFDVVAEKVNLFGPAFQVKGTVKLRAITNSFTVINGAMGEKYMLHLQAFLFSPNGKILWQQRGYPKGGWVNGKGDLASFILIDAFEGSIKKTVLLIIAAGHPIISDNSETMVILGVKRIRFL